MKESIENSWHRKLIYLLHNPLILWKNSHSLLIDICPHYTHFRTVINVAVFANQIDVYLLRL